MLSPFAIQMGAALIFAAALLHSFSTKQFDSLADRGTRHSGLWHLLAEVEVVFGLWAMVLVFFLFFATGSHETIAYLESRTFTEPMFVFAIMVVAGTRPILRFAGGLVDLVARALPLRDELARYFLILAFVPLLGSVITEPAAMTLAALMLRDQIFTDGVSTRFRYATLGVLFVNISIGGTLTAFAAPPVLMVAAKWGWDNLFMLTTFGWKAAIAVFINAAAAAALFRRELAPAAPAPVTPMPRAMVLVHLMFLAGIVVFAHHPVIFIGILLFFLGFATAYDRHQDPLILREALLVAFFLAGLVVLGGQQSWWLKPLLTSLDDRAVYYGATFMTAFTDNAALTYLGSLVEGLSDEFKTALVAGAVSGGGLTVIANAPNPAGATILKDKFPSASISPAGLALAALPPTLVAMVAFRLL